MLIHLFGFKDSANYLYNNSLIGIDKNVCGEMGNWKVTQEFCFTKSNCLKFKSVRFQELRNISGVITGYR